MASGELVYLPVLNFLQFSRNNGVDDDLIIRHALEFFDAAAVVAAKSAFWNKVLRGEICPRRAGNKATQSHLRAILELLAKCDSEDLTVPTYVILSANEVPSVPDLMFSHLSSKLTRMEKVLNAVASQFNEQYFPSNIHEPFDTPNLVSMPKDENSPCDVSEKLKPDPGHILLASAMLEDEDCSKLDVESKNFYLQLHSLVDAVPKKDISFVIGDFNAIVRTAVAGNEDATDNFGLGRLNKRENASLSSVEITIWQLLTPSWNIESMKGRHWPGRMENP
ncbi:hypothetical protein QYM36_006934 [Artemia franciscana]|uniref:Endonuclease/exonuclease/phosphatase domain-containing protein n=1 Tax=Artemia franciscana TaxID=6661 RepID=A0AA88L4M9_ARTSF|nr:hypothetical protein QYM36_006934 [Artemia franciscana]